ncbi:hypothetical protein MtrunA17_Chr8g0388701 [Medicago truncatula]|uniref:Uncharacterized protein n=1 Tax=Medicago truncatula TaxID=3880 RepID=A0A396GQU2_MEDTR|nr:hypothetical protein MtrunA17_Chr8g0388701 [Medicago truncatula]
MTSCQMLPCFWYHNRYIFISCLVLEKNYPCAQLHATWAIGICAMFGGDQFKASVSADGNVKTLCDTAVAALGRICEFHRDSTGPTGVKRWLYFLPLKHDFKEARYAHGLFSKLVQRSDEHLFGSYHENLPKIILVVKEILSGHNRLGTEEATNQMIDFIDQHDGMEIGTEEASSTIRSSSY